MRRIAVVNQKGGVGKTTTVANLGAALAWLGRRVVVIDMDPQANLSMYLGSELAESDGTSYAVLTAGTRVADALRPTPTPGLSLVASHIDLSGAELELASAVGREQVLADALDSWEREERARTGGPPADYVLLDCPPSLGLLSINGLAAAREVIIALQTEFFALQGMSKLMEVVELVQRRLNPGLVISGILPCLYDSRLRLGREVLAEIRSFFPGQVYRTSVRTNVKLAESPSYGQTIFDYAPDSNGARDYLGVALEVIQQERGDPDLASRPPAQWSGPPETEGRRAAPRPGVGFGQAAPRPSSEDPGPALDEVELPARPPVGAPLQPRIEAAAPVPRLEPPLE